MRKSLRRTGCLLVPLAVIGCRQYDVRYAPFNPRELQQTERTQPAPQYPQPPHALPTTLEAEFPVGANATTMPATQKAPPVRTMPTRQRPRSCRPHNFIRNAPFSTLFTDRSAVLRDVLSTMFLQGFSHSATQRNAALPPLPRGNGTKGATQDAHSRGKS